jgi:hypothetical protein
MAHGGDNRIGSCSCTLIDLQVDCGFNDFAAWCEKEFREGAETRQTRSIDGANQAAAAAESSTTTTHRAPTVAQPPPWTEIYKLHSLSHHPSANSVSLCAPPALSVRHNGPLHWGPWFAPPCLRQRDPFDPTGWSASAATLAGLEEEHDVGRQGEAQDTGEARWGTHLQKVAPGIMRPPAARPLSPSALLTMVLAANHYYIKTEQRIWICSTVHNRKTWMVKSGNVLSDVRFVFVHHGEFLIRLNIFNLHKNSCS